MCSDSTGWGKKKERRKIHIPSRTEYHSNEYIRQVSRIYYISIVCALYGNSNRASTSDIITSTYLFEMSFSVDTIQPPSNATTINSIPMLPVSLWIHHTRKSSRCQFVQYVSNSFTHRVAVRDRVSTAHFNNKPIFNSVYLKNTLSYSPIKEKL